MRGRPEAVASAAGASLGRLARLIGKVYERANDVGVALRIGQRIEKHYPHLHPRAAALCYDQLGHGIRSGELDVIAGTSWMWSREQFGSSTDALFVDEAGQLSLANVLSVAHAARTLVLLGDPQQLAQPSEVAHPPGAEASALEHILGDHATMPTDAGLLLDQTWRMHPELCQYTSDAFYDGRLTARPGLERQVILGQPPLRGAGLRIVEVPHEGNTNASPEEAAVVARLVNDLLGYQWSDKAGAEHSLGRRMSSSSRRTTRRSGRSARRWPPSGAPPPSGWDRGQVPGARGPGGHLLDGRLVGR